MNTATLIRETFYWGGLQFKDSAHYHHGSEHGSVQIDMVLAK